GPAARRRAGAAPEAYFLYVERADARGNEKVGMGRRHGRAARRVQLRGAARRPHARRTLCTLSVRTSAATKQMGPYRRPTPTEEGESERSILLGHLPGRGALARPGGR